MYTAIRQVSSPVVLWPAYGKRHATAEELLKAWKDGKEFRFAPRGHYCSVRDMAAIMAEHPSTVYLQDPHGRVQVKIG